jgi:hypothetical protein
MNLPNQHFWQQHNKLTYNQHVKTEKAQNESSGLFLLSTYVGSAKKNIMATSTIS